MSRESTLHGPMSPPPIDYIFNPATWPCNQMVETRFLSFKFDSFLFLLFEWIIKWLHNQEQMWKLIASLLYQCGFKCVWLWYNHHDNSGDLNKYSCMQPMVGSRLSTPSTRLHLVAKQQTQAAQTIWWDLEKLLSARWKISNQRVVIGWG